MGRLAVWQWRAGRRPPKCGPIELVTTRPHFGGLRYWFACPKCRRRVAVLWQPDLGDPWRCLRCHDLTYRSRQEAYRNESQDAGWERIGRHLEANGGWGTPEQLEKFFDDMKRGDCFGVIKAMLRMSRNELEMEIAAYRAEKKAQRLMEDKIDLSDHS